MGACLVLETLTCIYGGKDSPQGFSGGVKSLGFLPWRLGGLARASEKGSGSWSGGLQQEERLVLLGGGRRCGSAGMKEPQNVGSSGQEFLNSLGSERPSLRTGGSQMGLRGQRLGIISRFWGRSLKEPSIRTGAISRALGTGGLPVRLWVAQRGSWGLGLGGDGAQGEGRWQLGSGDT